MRFKGKVLILNLIYIILLNIEILWTKSINKSINRVLLNFRQFMFHATPQPSIRRILHENVSRRGATEQHYLGYVYLVGTTGLICWLIILSYFIEIYLYEEFNLGFLPDSVMRFSAEERRWFSDEKEESVMMFKFLKILKILKMWKSQWWKSGISESQWECE